MIMYHTRSNQRLVAKNGKQYFVHDEMAVDGYENQFVVTNADCDGPRLLFCEIHKITYSLHEHCPDCVSQVVEADSG